MSKPSGPPTETRESVRCVLESYVIPAVQMKLSDRQQQESLSDCRKNCDTVIPGSLAFKILQSTEEHNECKASKAEFPMMSEPHTEFLSGVALFLKWNTWLNEWST